jgi:hypothetical protein
MVDNDDILPSFSRTRTAMSDVTFVCHATDNTTGLIDDARLPTGRRTR